MSIKKNLQRTIFASAIALTGCSVADTEVFNGEIEGEQVRFYSAGNEHESPIFRGDKILNVTKANGEHVIYGDMNFNSESPHIIPYTLDVSWVDGDNRIKEPGFQWSQYQDKVNDYLTKIQEKNYSNLFKQD